MKFILLLSLSISFSAFGQNEFIDTDREPRNSYGISVGIGGGLIVKQALSGGPSYNLNTGFSIGLQYTRRLTNKLQMMTSINWYHNKVTVTPGPYPGIDLTPENYDMQIIYIPFFLRLNVSTWFFIHGGPIADLDITNAKYITSQSGIGAGFGLGGEFPVNKKFSLQINPYINMHGIILADTETYPERIFDAGAKVNLIFKR